MMAKNLRPFVILILLLNSFEVRATSSALLFVSNETLLPRGNWRDALEPYDLELVAKFESFLKKHPFPASALARAQWYVDATQDIPLVLISATRNMAGRGDVFNAFPFPGGGGQPSADSSETQFGLYSNIEAALPIGFLNALYQRLFPSVPLNRNFEPFTVPAASLPYSPELFGIIRAVLHTPIHVMTAEFKTHILAHLFVAEDSAYLPWELSPEETTEAQDHGFAPSHSEKGPAYNVRRAIVSAVVTDGAWLLGNSDYLLYSLIKTFAAMDLESDLQKRVSHVLLRANPYAYLDHEGLIEIYRARLQALQQNRETLLFKQDEAQLEKHIRESESYTAPKVYQNGCEVVVRNGDV